MEKKILIKREGEIIAARKIHAHISVFHHYEHALVGGKLYGGKH